jgi:hypothetical protein
VPGYGQYPQPRGQRLQTPEWGQPQRQPPVYMQPPGDSRYRPLEEESRSDSRSTTPQPQPAQRWAVRPYDRRAGSSFGENGAATGGYPYGSAYGGYYGTPYGSPGTWPGGYGTGWPSAGYPTTGWPMVW